MYVGYPQLQQAVATMKNISQVIDAKLDALRKQLAAVPWEGDARTAWQIHQYDWDTAVQEMNMLLQEMARRVNVAMQNYITTENEVSRTWRNATLP
jgi:WXG100 family type VII secretion target